MEFARPFHAHLSFYIASLWSLFTLIEILLHVEVHYTGSFVNVFTCAAHELRTAQNMKQFVYFLGLR